VGSFRHASDSAVLAATAEDRDAFEELFRRYRRIVFRYAARRCDRPADVDDVVAATFLAALESSHQYDSSRGEVRPWLLGIAHNQLGLLRRSQRRLKNAERVTANEAQLSEDALGRLVEQLAAVEQVASLQRALQQLPERQREALILISGDELSLKEAAAVVGISASAFRVRLFRARRTMQALLPADTESQRYWPLPKEAEK
jgi:RNA polymerase sigma-70 factor (ECF subfamily)